jgi:hypothetical protein
MSVKQISEQATFQFVLDCLNNYRKKWKSYSNSFGYVEPGKPVIVIIEGCYFYDVYLGSREYRKHLRYYFPFPSANKLFHALYPNEEDDPIAGILAYLHEEENRITSLF